MPPSRRDAPTRARLVLASVLCVAGVLAVLFFGGRSPSAPSAVTATAGRVAHLSLVAHATSGRLSHAARLAEDTPGAHDVRQSGPRDIRQSPSREPGASARASGAPPRAAKGHDRPFDAAYAADGRVTGWTPTLAGSPQCPAAPPSGASGRRSAEQPASHDRDVHAPRGPPARLTV
jgi:hypothetical protein